ncbi:acyltransferase domain-containing protein, partial [Streptomyces aculeolatus]
ELLAAHPQVAIAAHNAPTTLTLSGPDTALATVEEALSAQGIRVRRLHVSHAFHSPLMNPILDDFHHTAQTLTYHPPTIPIISNHNGEPATTEQLTDPGYWTQHIRTTVHYATTVETLHRAGVTTYLEAGPDTTLTTLTQQTLTT